MDANIEETSQSDADQAKVVVGLGEREYDILIAPGLLAGAGVDIASRLGVRRVAVVSDENVHGIYGKLLDVALADKSFPVFHVTVPAGESSKSFSMLERVTAELLEGGIERGDLVIALGGGVVGDLAGFAAGILRRGVRFVQAPTSLLAQVDSSVGGKTGINTGHGKNLIGMFHQPGLVLADVTVLDTLPVRELRAGYAEVVKYGLISDRRFFGWLERNGADLLAGDVSKRIYAVTKCCQAKADIVAADEREGGVRALLNLGHTFGHALEAAAGYDGRLVHGEGVAIGMALAAGLSVELGLCTEADLARIESHLRASGLPSRIADIAGPLPTADELIELMRQDKKVRDGNLTFILLRGIGDAFTTQEVPQDRLRNFLNEVHKPS